MKNQLFVFAATPLFFIFFLQAGYFSAFSINYLNIFPPAQTLSQKDKTPDGETTPQTRPANGGKIMNEEGMTLKTRFNPPRSYKRVPLEAGSFGSYLRNFKLKPDGALVYYYDGRVKPNRVHAAVFDIDIGEKDLQQCADAVIRLYAEYLFLNEKYDEIGFHFTNGFFAAYTPWRGGKRIRITGNKAEWVSTERGRDDSYANFRRYLEYVFIYAGTISLSKELSSVPYSELFPGDVLVQPGSPGHAVLVIDAAVNERGKKIYMLAQSYMPAQSTHILINKNNPDISPWYELEGRADLIHTPEWTFTKNDLKKFPVNR